MAQRKANPPRRTTLKRKKNLWEGTKQRKRSFPKNKGPPQGANPHIHLPTFRHSPPARSGCLAKSSRSSFHLRFFARSQKRCSNECLPVRGKTRNGQRFLVFSFFSHPFVKEDPKKRKHRWVNRLGGCFLWFFLRWALK